MRHNDRSEKHRRREAGHAKPDHSLQLMSAARRFARQDRQCRPIHCAFAHKLMYDTEEIARSTGQQMARLAAKPHYVYQCPARRKADSHWHLTTQSHDRDGAPNEQA